MWKYKCRSQLLSLAAAFLLGVVLMALSMGSNSYLDVLSGVLPDEIISFYQANPYILYIAGGLLTAGICNIFLIGNFLMNQFQISPFLVFFAMMLFPSYVIVIGIFSIPVMIAVSLYGWISLEMQNRGMLRSKNVTSDDELIRIYLLHHTLLEQYEPMAMEIRKTIRKIDMIYALGIVGVFCVMMFVNNLFLSIIAIFLYMLAFQYLARYKNNVFMPISNLLYDQCDPEACMSALIYYSKHKNHYKIRNQALMATCLIYLDDPDLAQDIMITYPRGNVNSMMTYWSIMAYTYYLLKDKSGLERCKEAISKIRPGMGAMGVMFKTQEQNSIENKIRLMDRDFNTCKQYYLEQLKQSTTKLHQADCQYYIALISFVQEDYPLAALYFEKTIQNGNKLYFVRNAKNYLSKIHDMGIDVAGSLTY